MGTNGVGILIAAVVIAFGAPIRGQFLQFAVAPADRSYISPCWCRKTLLSFLPGDVQYGCGVFTSFTYSVVSRVSHFLMGGSDVMTSWVS